MRNNSEENYVGWIVIPGVIVMPKDEIADVKLLSFTSEDGDSEIDSKPIVRLIKKTPTVEFICANEAEAESLIKFLNSSKKVINLSEYRKANNAT